MGIREKFVLAVMIGVAAFIALFTLSLLEQRKVVLAAYEARNASVVDLTVSMLQQIDARRLEGQMDLKAAQDQAKATLRALRYDNGDYIFVLGLDGGFIVNPGFPHLEGTVPRDLVDVEGRPLLSRLADVAAQGVGTVRYRYPRVHGGESVEKTSAVRLFAPWGWVVGSGAYVDDVQTMFAKRARQFAVVVVPLGLVLIAGVFWLARSVAVPLRDLVAGVHAIRRGDFGRDVSHTDRADELGQLAEAVESLRQVAVMEDEVQRSRELMAKVFDTSREAVLITDSGGRIVLASAALCAISGYAAADLVGQKASILKSGHHDDEFFADMWTRLINGGAWEGEVWNRRANGEVLVVYERISAIRDDSGRILNFVAIMHDVVEHSRNQRGARFLPMHDPLTNLADHDLLAEQASRMLAKASRTGRPVALLVVDVDDFAQVNAAHGMVAGDEILRFIALRLMKVVRGADMVARLGGDDYAVLMEDYSGVAEIRAVATRIIEAMHAALSIGDSKIGISVSVGIAQAPQDGRGFSQLLKAARAAQGLVKAGGGNGFHLTGQDAAA